MELPALKLPQIRPGSNNTSNTDRPTNKRTDNNSYDQWRASIHRELEEDLQRQVNQIIEETERQEHLAKLRRQYLRAGLRFPPQNTGKKNHQNDAWNEIDRRNQRILHPLNAKDSYSGQNHRSTVNNQSNKLTSNSFNSESFDSQKYHQRLSCERNPEHLLDESSLNFGKHDRQGLLILSNDDFLYGNSIIKSNKADILHIIDQKSQNNEQMQNYINKHGINISLDGPFWPHDFRILHSTPKLLSRELTPREFYSTGNNSPLSSD